MINEILQASDKRFGNTFNSLSDIIEKIGYCNTKKQIKKFIHQEITSALEKMASEIVPENRIIYKNDNQIDQAVDYGFDICLANTKLGISKFLGK
jgi:hypothetical protein